MAPTDHGSQLLRGFLALGSVLYFREDTHQESSPPHYFVILNDPQSADILLLVYATSQQATVQRYASCFPAETVVEVTSIEYSEFTEEKSYFNCNQIIEKTLHELETLLHQGLLTYKTPIPPAILEKLKAGVLSSPAIKNEHKNLLK